MPDMKKGLMLLMLAACLFVGCGNEKTTVKPEAKKSEEVHLLQASRHSGYDLWPC